MKKLKQQMILMGMLGFALSATPAVVLACSKYETVYVPVPAGALGPLVGSWLDQREAIFATEVDIAKLKREAAMEGMADAVSRLTEEKGPVDAAQTQRTLAAIKEAVRKKEIELGVDKERSGVAASKQDMVKIESAIEKLRPGLVVRLKTLKRPDFEAAAALLVKDRDYVKSAKQKQVETPCSRVL